MEGGLPNFYEANITLISNPGKATRTTTKRKRQDNSSDGHELKVHNKIWASRIHQKDYPTTRQVSVISEMQEWLNMHKSININHINRLQDKNHTIVSIGAEKAIGKT